MPIYGLPYFLEDITGVLTGSDFVDMHGRMRLSVRCTLQDGARAVYMVHDAAATAQGRARVQEPAAVLDFGPGGTLGSVVIGAHAPVPMATYLSKTARFGRCARCARSARRVEALT
jgi:hypothetical protein